MNSKALKLFNGLRPVCIIQCNARTGVYFISSFDFLKGEPEQLRIPNSFTGLLNASAIWQVLKVAFGHFLASVHTSNNTARRVA